MIKFECACGETFHQAAHAINCSKCSVYAPDERSVAVNLATGERLYRDDVFPPPVRSPEQQAHIDAALAKIFG